MNHRDPQPTSDRHLSLARQLAATAQHLASTDDPRLSTLVARVYAETDRIADSRSTFEAAVAHAELLFSRRRDDAHSK